MTHQPVAAPIRLPYGTDAPAGRRRRGPRLASLVALLPGLVVPFVPFACDSVPANAVGDAVGELLRPGSGADGGTWGAALLSLPFFLVVPLAFWKFRRLLDRPVARAERLACSAAGWVGMAAFAGFLGMAAYEGDLTAGEWALLAASAIPPGFALAVVVLVRRQRGGAADDRRLTALLAGPYVGAVGLSLVAYVANAQLGWWLALAPVVAASGELAVVAWPVLRGVGHARAPA